jgi:hypothetical protein
LTKYHNDNILYLLTQSTQGNMMNQCNLNDEQIQWFAERIDTSATGVVIVKSSLVTKFKKMFPEEHLSNEMARTQIIRNCQEFI